MVYISCWLYTGLHPACAYVKAPKNASIHTDIQHNQNKINLYIANK